MKFSEKVYELLKKIPTGKVTTYGEIGKQLGSGMINRAVGNALNKNPNIGVVPCHRVVKSDGEIGGFALGVEKKISMLRAEGVEVVDGTVDLEKYFFKF